VAGIVNVTPDSFSDGGLYQAPERALGRCRALADEGAHLLDIGAESTRPGSAGVTPEEELARLRDVAGSAPAIGIPVFVDTWRASTAAAVLDMGVHGINDISGATFDPAMADVLGQYKPGYVLMHTPAPPRTMQAHARYDSVVDSVRAFFEENMARLVRAGLPENRIALDPGIGFGKNLEQNLAILRHIERLHTFGRPLYIGISRKTFLGELLQAPVSGRDAPTHTATAMLASRGVYAHRVHDVAGAVAALRLASALGPL
jgi:dihydropteroate synthase